MATLQSNHVCDSSTLANFKDWAQSISTAFSTFGWSQASDTGQVNWSSIASVPTGSTWVYEIWQPNDGVANNFYAKIEYGNNGTTNSPTIRLSIGTSTNGSGTLTGTVMGPTLTAFSNFTAPSSSTTYECDYSGAAGRISVLMWRNGTNSCQQVFVIERSRDSSGAATSSYVTMVLGGHVSSTDWAAWQQQSLVFGVGVTTVASKGNGTSSMLPDLAVRRLAWNGASTAFNGQIPFDCVAPCIGYFDYPMTGLGVAATQDVTEGIAFSVSLYGATRTYMPTLNGDLTKVFNNQSLGQVAICVRYD